MGRQLVRENPIAADIVVPVPDSGNSPSHQGRVSRPEIIVNYAAAWMLIPDDSDAAGTSRGCRCVAHYSIRS